MNNTSYNGLASLDAEQKNTIIAESAGQLRRSRDRMDGSLTKKYVEILADLSFVIESIQNGFGNREREQDENPAEVLAELRDAFGFDYVSSRTADLLDIAEYEQTADSLTDTVERIMRP